MIKKLSELNKGDIFKFEDKSWERHHRIHSIDKVGKRYLINFISMNYFGESINANANSFTWRDKDIKVFIPKFNLSDWKSSKGKPYISLRPEHDKARWIFPYKLNECNINN